MDDVATDNYRKDSNISPLGETHLQPREIIEFNEFQVFFAGAGKGKGIVAYTK